MGCLHAVRDAFGIITQRLTANKKGRLTLFNCTGCAFRIRIRSDFRALARAGPTPRPSHFFLNFLVVYFFIAAAIRRTSNAASQLLPVAAGQQLNVCLFRGFGAGPFAFLT